MYFVRCDKTRACDDVTITARSWLDPALMKFSPIFRQNDTHWINVSMMAKMVC
jgi:hypothetical protein